MIADRRRPCLIRLNKCDVRSSAGHLLADSFQSTPQRFQCAIGVPFIRDNVLHILQFGPQPKYRNDIRLLL